MKRVRGGLVVAGEKGWKGRMVLFSLRSWKVGKDFGIVDDDSVSDLDLSRDGKSIITGTVKGGLGIFSVGAQRLVRNHVSVCKCVHSLRVCKNGEEVFIITGSFNNATRMILVGLRSGDTIKDFGKIHEANIKTFFMSRDGEILMTGDEKGYCKEWSVGARARIGESYCRIDGGASVVVEI